MIMNFDSNIFYSLNKGDNYLMFLFYEYFIYIRNLKEKN